MHDYTAATVWKKKITHILIILVERKKLPHWNQKKNKFPLYDFLSLCNVENSDRITVCILRKQEKNVVLTVELTRNLDVQNLDIAMLLM